MHVHRSAYPTSRASAVRRSMLVVGFACGVALAFPAMAEVKGLEIIAPAGPGGGYDQLARATQEVLQKHDLASGVQVQNIPGAGGTIGLAQFVTKNARTQPDGRRARLGGRHPDQQVAGHARPGGAARAADR